MYMGRGCFKRDGINKGEIRMQVEVTLKFDYPWNDPETDEQTIKDLLMELSPDELLAAANKFGESLKVEIEVYK